MSAEPGGRTAIPAPGSTSATTSTATASEPSDHWSEFFAQQPELQAYFQGVMERHGVTGPRPVQHRGDLGGVGRRRRHLGGDRPHPDGASETLRARAVISAVGQLNAPYVPDFPGAEQFAGPAFPHRPLGSRCGPHRPKRRDDRRGRHRFQVAPAIADTVGTLTIFSAPRSGCSEPELPRQGRAGVRWALRHLPFHGRWYRFLIFWPGCDSGLAAARSTRSGRISNAPSARPTTSPG